MTLGIPSLVGRLSVFTFSILSAFADPIAAPVAQEAGAGSVSGGVFVVGQSAFSDASPAICPNNAPQGCGNINVWNWCCSAGTTCVKLQSGNIGCCPSGAQCPANINVAAITTVTVLSNPTPAPNPVVVSTTPQVTQAVIPAEEPEPQEPVVICSTMFATGPNLPTTAAGPCGLVLILNDATLLAPRGAILALWVTFWASGFLVYVAR